MLKNTEQQAAEPGENASTVACLVPKDMKPPGFSDYGPVALISRDEWAGEAGDGGRHNEEEDVVEDWQHAVTSDCVSLWSAG